MFDSLTIDNIDSKTALDHIRDLITATNIYMDGKRKSSAAPDRGLLVAIATFVTRMMKVLVTLVFAARNRTFITIVNSGIWCHRRRWKLWISARRWTRGSQCKWCLHYISLWYNHHCHSGLTECLLWSQIEEAVMPYLDVFATFREEVRAVSRQQKGCFDLILLLNVTGSGRLVSSSR